ncbi:serine racemase VanT catalytic subunit [Ruminococcus sp. CLA-AA-H200]|uniref:Alanine racemase n=1 Tax=Ruminococcus turbiniformis TaxID=2881258 RepID=A0ABS8FWY9_9FIRM|nr:serine racemase VanT catalytic subunit [Ruminococcus turbiniformis]MCC2253687.1 serine racemase VanT catalytic subunit [Ruminococcus turbiniformis]
MSVEKRRAWIELDEDSLLHNVRELQRVVGRDCRLMPAVKANAYGHGDVETARLLAGAGISDFCVASADEGIRLRAAGISGQILILGYTLPAQFDALREYDLTQTVVEDSYAQELSAYGRELRVHVGVDTGMHRLGIPASDADAVASVWRFPNLKITGMFSHLCVSDGTTEEERRYTEKQISDFRKVIGELRRRGIRGFESHIQGSYGILNYPEEKFDCARPGIALYGVLSLPSDRVRADVTLSPVLSLKARVGCVRMLKEGESAGYGLTYTADGERKLAIVCAGYADGIPRSLSNRGYALVRGYRAPIVGRICMDQLTLDVTEVPGVRAGDEAVFIGKSGGREIGAAEMAECAGTISNELLSRLGQRPERICFTHI